MCDRGIDGIAYFYSQPTETSKIVFQVKSGGVQRGDIAKLNSDMQREDGVVGVLITLEEPSRNMITEARAIGPYVHPMTGRKIDRIKIVTVREMLEEHRRIELSLNIEVLRAFQRISNAKQLELKLSAPLQERKQNQPSLLEKILPKRQRAD